MNPITCLADILAHTPRVRVIKEWDKNYGKEFVIDTQMYAIQQISIDTLDWEYKTYDYSDIQFLTPVQYEWRYIGFGDKVNGYEVFGSCWFCDSWNLNVSKNYISSYIRDMSNIESFQPLHQLTPKIELSTEEMIAELQRRGVVTEGKIINN